MISNGLQQNSDFFMRPNGDRVLYNQARNTLNKEIRAAKRSYAKKLEDQFISSDPSVIPWLYLITMIHG